MLPMGHKSKVRDTGCYGKGGNPINTSIKKRRPYTVKSPLNFLSDTNYRDIMNFSAGREMPSTIKEIV